MNSTDEVVSLDFDNTLLALWLPADTSVPTWLCQRLYCPFWTAVGNETETSVGFSPERTTQSAFPLNAYDGEVPKQHVFPRKSYHSLCFEIPETKPFWWTGVPRKVLLVSKLVRYSDFLRHQSRETSIDNISWNLSLRWLFKLSRVALHTVGRSMETND